MLYIALAAALAWFFSLLRYETELGKEGQSVNGTPIYPVSANNTQYTGTSDMTKFNRIEYWCYVSTLGAAANVQFQVQTSANANGAGNTNVAGLTVTISAASQMGSLEMRADQVPTGQKYVQCAMIVNTAATICGCFPVAWEARNKPQNTDDLSVQVANRIAL